MQDKLAKLEQKVLQLEAEHKKRMDAREKLLHYATDHTKFLEVLEAQEKRMDYLANRLQTMINKECILTEVSRYVRRLGSADLIVDFHLQLMRAYNWGDEFWEQPKAWQFTAHEWLEKIMAVEDPMPEDSLQASLFDVI